MSYSRWPLYAWSDGYTMHLWVRPDPAEKRMCVMQAEPEEYDIEGGVNISEVFFDQLALLVVAEMVEEPKRLRRALRNLRKTKNPFRGNFGSYPLLEAMGEDPVAALKSRLDKEAI